MDIEKIREFISSLEQIPCPEYAGIRWPTFLPFRVKDAETAIKDIMDFQSRETDILICTHSKSGTHWIYEITKLLLNNSTELHHEPKSKTMLETLETLSDLDQLPSPRVIDTHIPFQFLPRKHLKNKSKIIHMARNPKDVLVSLYYHVQKDKFLDLVNAPWSECFDVWMSGNMPYGSWYDYELGMEQAEKDYPGMIYTCFYEEMKKNPVAEIKKLAEFLEVERDPQTIEGIAKVTAFSNMQSNKFDSTSVLTTGKGFIFRKGEIGDWKIHFTVAQNEQFDAQYREKMKGSKYTFIFE